MNTKTNREKRSKKPLVLVLLVLLMLLTTCLTWVFWNGGILGTNTDRNYEVNIGEAGQVTTELNISAAAAQGSLIPYDAPLRSGDIHEAVFNVDVTWNAEAAYQDSEIYGVEGQLVITEVAFYINGVDYLNATGLAGADLFLVDITPANTTIYGGMSTGVAVEIRVRMNRPADRAQYDLVAGQDATLVVNFAVNV